MLPLERGPVGLQAGGRRPDGPVLKLYREWQLSGDTAFLQQIWPRVKQALDFAWAHWDADRDGVMEGEQHNTYDIEFYGPNSMMGALYLGALGRRDMAAALGDTAAAEEYRRIYDRAGPPQRSLCNGEYYVQKYDKVMETKYQYGDGCLSDQMLGQWLAMVVGLGRYLPPTGSVVPAGRSSSYNFLPTSGISQRPAHLRPQRREGSAACSWPKGGRPPLPFPYSDEVWTGIEYQVAAHLIYEGCSRRAWPSSRPCATATTASAATPGTSSSAAITTPGPCPRGAFFWPSRADVFGPRDEDRLRAENERGRLPDGLDGRFGLGHLFSKGGGGKRHGRRSRSRERRARPQRVRLRSAAVGGREDHPFDQDPPRGFTGRCSVRKRLRPFGSS